MAQDFVIFLIEAIPLAFLIGITAATIGYTAWGITVPLLFVGLGFPVFESLFVSLSIDVINSAILTRTYSKTQKVDFSEGTKYGLIAIVGAIIGLVLAIFLLEDNQNMLRGGVAYIFFLLGAFFFYRAYKTKIKEESEKTAEVNGSDHNVNNANNDQNKEENLLSPLAQYSIMIIGAFVTGIMSGFLGIGSGTNFTLLFMFVFGASKGFDTLKATGTGCYIMLLLTLFLSVSFGLLSSNIVFYIPYFLVMAISSGIGTIVGSKFAMKLSEWKLNILIGVAIIIAASAGSIQSILIG